MLKKRQWPQAVLLSGPRHANLLLLANQLVHHYLCREQRACGVCRTCRLLKECHPDVLYIKPEETAKSIKIETIRDLQQQIYLAPQYGDARFVLIEAADKMNDSAANALLKILEEPPSHSYFILLAEQISRLLPTILSRCQKYTVSAALNAKQESNDYLLLKAYYSEDESRGLLFHQQAIIIGNFCAVLEKKKTPCEVATLWASYPLDDLLWFLYLIVNQTLRYQLYNQYKLPNELSAIRQLALLTKPFLLFRFIEQIENLCAKINQNIPVNQILSLERLLLSYMD